MIRGLDASSCQGVIPYDKLGPEYRFVILKGQQGNDGFDPYLERNAKAALAHGVRAFPYCFQYPLPHLDPKKQAQLFVDRLSKTCLKDARIFLDMEWPAVENWGKWHCTAQQVSDWLAANAAEVCILTGKEPVLYTYPYWWKAVSKVDVSWASLYPLWIASYPSSPGWPKDGQRPVVPAPWPTWMFWQFDGNKGLKLPNGVDCDFDVFNGDEAALQAV